MPEIFSDMIYLVTSYWPYFLRGTRNTIVLALLAVVGGCLAGLIVALLLLFV